MLFDIPFIADLKIIGEHRQLLTDLNTSHENEGRIDYDYKVGQKVLIWKEDILHKTESRHLYDPWMIASVLKVLLNAKLPHSFKILSTARKS